MVKVIIKISKKILHRDIKNLIFLEQLRKTMHSIIKVFIEMSLSKHG